MYHRELCNEQESNWQHILAETSSYMHYTLDQSHSEIIERQLLENLEAEGKVVQMKFLALHNILLIKN